MRLLPFAVWGVIAFLILNPYLGDLLLPVAVYIVAIVIMMWRAAALVGAQGKSQDFELAALLGALAFGLSDTLLAFNHFIWHDTLTMFNINQAAPFISTLVIILYWLGQWGIALAAGWEAKDRARGDDGRSKAWRPRAGEIFSRLPVWRKVAYGAGDSGFSLTSTALALLYLFFLVNVVGLDPAAAGLSLGIGRIWDAFNDLFDRHVERSDAHPLGTAAAVSVVWRDPVRDRVHLDVARSADERADAAADLLHRDVRPVRHAVHPDQRAVHRADAGDCAHVR